MRVVVDGVFFQLNNTGIARVWASVLPLIAAGGGTEIFLLDRGGAPRIEGITNLPFPSYRGYSVAADSALIQKICEHVKADVFTTTYYTTPLSIPMVLMVYDMIPELFDFDMSVRGWMEKETAIAYAQRFVCISQSTRRDLLHFYSEIPPDHVQVAYCGIDTKAFAERPRAAVAEFRKAHGLYRPYFLFVGSRVQHKSYKNSDCFFNALKHMKAAEFDVFCVGGEEEVEPQVLDSLPRGVHCHRVVLSDYELSLAYAGATALVYPSLYEGFGMPVIEAMASGCPVITTHRGALGEAAGDAALLIEGTSASEMASALMRVQIPKVQADMRKRGLRHARRFRWEPMAELLSRHIATVADEAKTSTMQTFFAEWSRLRGLQAKADYQ